MRKPFNNSYRITQNFGENPASYARFGLKGHNGIDYATPTGTEIIATHSGKVLEATNDPTGYGLYIKIENSIEGSLYAHLKEFKVKVGDAVNEGQIIGLSDNTGNSTGPHLHFGYYRIPRDRANGYAGYIDPAPYFSPTQSGMTSITQKELDELREARDKNWNLYLEQVEIVKEKDIRISDLESALNDEKQNVIRIAGDLQKEQQRTSDLLTQLEKLTDEDKSTTEQLIDAQKALDPLKALIGQFYGILGLSGDVSDKDAVKALQALKDQKVKYIKQPILFRIGSLGVVKL